MSLVIKYWQLPKRNILVYIPVLLGINSYAFEPTSLNLANLFPDVSELTKSFYKLYFFAVIFLQRLFVSRKFLRIVYYARYFIFAASGSGGDPTSFLESAAEKHRLSVV